MLKIYTTVMSRLVRDEKGASAVEYAIVVGGIALAIITAVNSFGSGVGNVFTNLTGKLPS